MVENICKNDRETMFAITDSKIYTLAETLSTRRNTNRRNIIGIQTHSYLV